jgi:hypothetical protein
MLERVHRRIKGEGKSESRLKNLTDGIWCGALSQGLTSDSVQGSVAQFHRPNFSWSQDVRCPWNAM